MNPETRRQEVGTTLAALDAALADPVRLVSLLADAEDERDAVRRLQAALDLSAEQARSVLSLQFGALTRARRARIAEDLAVVRAAWGPTLPATLAFSGRRSAVLTVDGEERRVTAGGVDGVLDRAVQLLVADVAVPRLAPVLVEVSGLPGGPERFTVLPSRSASFDHGSPEGG
jgi:hypothetical protein